MNNQAQLSSELLVGANVGARIEQLENDRSQNSDWKNRPAQPYYAETMKPYVNLFATILLSGIATSLMAGEELLRYEPAQTGSEMIIEGTATGHGWTIKGVIINGSFEVDPAWEKDTTLKSVQCLGEGKTPPKCEVTIPVRSLKSQVAVGRSVMDNRMLKEMKAEQYPRIEYRLKEMKLAGDVPASGSPVKFETKGELAVAGTTNTVSFPVTMERLPDGKICFSGSYKTKMTSFGITPPEFTVLGVGSKTGDDITLKWKWVLVPKRETTQKNQ
ncbi:MAG: YceI family protein [Verrucomicrobiae bacterium]|nr:YceI family protein [Verrucomicrobiae bacterium]